MMQPGMHCTGVHKMRKSHLADPAQTLIGRVLNDLQYQWIINSDEAMYWIIDNFSDSGGHSVDDMLNQTPAGDGQKYNCPLDKIILLAFAIWYW